MTYTNSRINAYLYAIACMALLSSCGSAPADQGASSTVVESTTKPGQVSYSLTATREDRGRCTPASITVTKAASVIMPSYLTVVANASDNNRVVLTIGGQYCDYTNNHTTVYQRIDGSCNTFTPNAAISLDAGDTITLYIESDPTQHTAAQAVIEGTYE